MNRLFDFAADVATFLLFRACGFRQPFRTTRRNR